MFNSPSKKSADVLSALLESPQAAELMAQREKDIAKRRAALVAERAVLETKAEKDYRAHESELAAAMAEHATAEAALKVAKARVAKVIANRIGVSAEFNTRILAIEAELKDTAAPELDEFIALMWRDWEAARRVCGPETDTVVTNINTGKKTVVPGRSVVTPQHLMAAIREAIAAAEGLKFDPNQRDIPAKLLQMRQALPVIGAPRD